MTLDEAIRHCEEVADNCAVAECEMEHKQLAEWLKELKQRRAEQRWIPVEEKLPENEKCVLWTEEVRFVDGQRRNRVCTAYYDNENQDWLEIMGEDVGIISRPLAWMPLPKLYTRENK